MEEIFLINKSITLCNSRCDFIMYDMLLSKYLQIKESLCEMCTVCALTNDLSQALKYTAAIKCIQIKMKINIIKEGTQQLIH